MTPSTEAADAAIVAAARLVQEAQGALARASGALAAVVPCAEECDAIGKEYDRVRALWYRLQQVRLAGGLRLDSEPK